jgi:hypothetical protein
MLKSMALAAALSLAAATVLAHNCPNEMKAIDARLPAAKLSEADMTKVKKLRADGETAHKAGNHDESMKLLGEAKKLLGL